MDAVAHLGPDLLGDGLGAEDRRGEPGCPIRTGRWPRALLDQRVMAGVGNVYANELCFVTGHLPTAPVSRCRTRCGWCSAPGTCCGSTAPG